VHILAAAACVALIAVCGHLAAVHLPRIAAHPFRTAPQKRDRPPAVAPVRVRKPDGNLRQPLPQVALLGRPGLPRSLKNLVRMKRPSRPQQPVRDPYRLGGWQVIGEHQPLRHMQPLRWRR
jgi:hypothetical protein